MAPGREHCPPTPNCPIHCSLTGAPQWLTTVRHCCLSSLSLSLGQAPCSTSHPRDPVYPCHKPEGGHCDSSPDSQRAKLRDGTVKPQTQVPTPAHTGDGMSPGLPLFPASPQLLQMQPGPLSRVALPLLQPLLGSQSREGSPRRGSFPPLRETMLLFQSHGHILFLRTRSSAPQLPEAATPMQAVVTT